jgi:hypothetical protein
VALSHRRPGGSPLRSHVQYCCPDPW